MGGLDFHVFYDEPMSYCRFAWNGSDVYVFEHVDGGYECCGCSIGKQWRFITLEEMIVHLAEHKRAGHFVPMYAIIGLWRDIPGPNKAVKPEPEALKKSRLMMKRIVKELRRGKAKN